MSRLERLIPTRFFDENGLIVQDPSMSDRCNPEVDSMFLTANSHYLMREKFYWWYYVDESGMPRRYWREGVNGHPYNSFRNLSRDNLLGMVIYLGFSKEHGYVSSLFRRILLNGSRFFNYETTKGEKKVSPDFLLPDEYSVFLRAIGNKWLYPLILIFDVVALISMLYTIARSWVYPTKASTVYHTLAAVDQGLNYYVTPFSYVSYLLFVHCRRPVKGYPSRNGVISALMYYSRAPYDPPIQKVAREYFNLPEDQDKRN